MMQLFNSPFIVKYHESFMDRNTLYIIMEYCDDGDLNGYFVQCKKKCIRIPEDQVLNWFAQITLGLDFIHKKKILHRDIKAGNIFLTTKNMCKLGDFGISRSLANTRDMAHTLVGTPYYMSPELSQNRPYDYKSDIWALGCLLYEMCTFCHPFEAQNYQQLVQRIARGFYKPIPTPPYSKNLSTLVDKMLKQNPADRPTTDQILDLPFIREQLKSFIKTSLTNRNPTLVIQNNPQEGKEEEAPQVKQDLSQLNALLPKARGGFAVPTVPKAAVGSRPETDRKENEKRKEEERKLAEEKQKAEEEKKKLEAERLQKEEEERKKKEEEEKKRQKLEEDRKRRAEEQKKEEERQKAEEEKKKAEEQRLEEERKKKEEDKKSAATSTRVKSAKRVATSSSTKAPAKPSLHLNPNSSRPGRAVSPSLAGSDDSQRAVSPSLKVSRPNSASRTASRSPRPPTTTRTKVSEKSQAPKTSSKRPVTPGQRLSTPKTSAKRETLQVTNATPEPSKSPRPTKVASLSIPGTKPKIAGKSTDDKHKRNLALFEQHVNKMKNEKSGGITDRTFDKNNPRAKPYYLMLKQQEEKEKEKQLLKEKDSLVEQWKREAQLLNAVKPKVIEQPPIRPISAFKDEPEEAPPGKLDSLDLAFDKSFAMIGEIGFDRIEAKEQEEEKKAKKVENEEEYVDALTVIASVLKTGHTPQPVRVEKETDDDIKQAKVQRDTKNLFLEAKKIRTQLEHDLGDTLFDSLYECLVDQDKPNDIQLANAKKVLGSKPSSNIDKMKQLMRLEEQIIPA
ncbi:putative G2-specific protein kinase fin1 [Blattamonas nauphoetae]|uniref:non-specific serine/threonine protein kinase n=1 Tax=Blattamonas nauphoetae TaxID=2049346 RepID=A0ABQ9X3K9_9EUKA|nr:putative G2-specific protein kinase fin1 [Blattamonas nauphoetae]